MSQSSASNDTNSDDWDNYNSIEQSPSSSSSLNDSNSSNSNSSSISTADQSSWSTLYVMQSITECVSLFSNEYITSTHGGSSHILFCTLSGNVYAYGSNQQGQCGLGDRVDLTNGRVMHIASLPPCKQVACGYEYSMFLTRQGEVYATGQGQYGQLGLSSKISVVYAPQKVPYFEGHGLVVEQIACGYYHSLFLTTGGQLYTCGHAHNGQCGVARTDGGEIVTPTLVDSLVDHRIVQVAPGGYHTMVLTEANRLFVFGQNGSGQLGLSHFQGQSMPAEVIFDHGSIPRKILCGGEFSSVLTMDGVVFSTGSNSEGQLGLASTDKQATFTRLDIPGTVEDVCHGKYQNTALTTDGSLYVTGFTGKDGKLRQFKNIENIGLSSAHLSKIRQIVDNRSPSNQVKLYAAYRDVLFTVAQGNPNLKMFFDRLRHTKGFRDVDIVTLH